MSRRETLSGKMAQPTRAVVIGGSIAGLLSAKVLSGFYSEVVIVERDDIRSEANARGGVPQSVQPHILLTQGYRILAEFFPGLAEDLTAAGAVPIDWGTDFRYFSAGGWNALQAEPTDLKSFSCTRPLLEATVRRRVECIENVSRRSPYRVDALISAQVGGQAAVTGVECIHRNNRSARQRIEADLVVDASGRSTNATKWLAALGIQPPSLETVDARLGYATRRYRIPEHWSADWKVLLVSHRPPAHSQLGYLAQVEGGELIATLGGYCQEYPPLKSKDFLQAAQQLPASEFYEAILPLTPTSEIKAYRATANKLRHYERLSQMPAGFVAIGDAVCALCPAYGQGISTSAMSATVLKDWLAKGGMNKTAAPLNSLSFQKQLFKTIKPAWTIAAKSDSGFDSAQGKLATTPLDRILSKYMQRLLRQSQSDHALSLQLARISHMVDSPIGLFHPKNIIKAI